MYAIDIVAAPVLTCFSRYIISDLLQEKGPLEFFIKIKFLAWIDSSVCTEYNGASFKEKSRSQAELWLFLCTWVDIVVFRNGCF